MPPPWTPPPPGPTTRPWPRSSTRAPTTRSTATRRRDQAELAARLLGAARAVRGAFDESSPDAPQARTAARAALGEAAFDNAYQSTADLTYEASLALARETLTAVTGRPE